MSIQQNPKYPSREQIALWSAEWKGAGGMELIQNFIARKACDWQRHQDAEICLGEKVDADATGEATDFSYNVACDHCAHSVRHSIRTEAKAKEFQPGCKCEPPPEPYIRALDRICPHFAGGMGNDENRCWCGHDLACHIVGGKG